MKKTIFISILLLIISMSFTPSDSHKLKIDLGEFGGDYGKFFSIEGDLTNDFVDALFIKYPDVKRKNYEWKFKDVLIPGIESLVTIKVSRGVHFVLDETGRLGFNTFTDKTVEYLTSLEEDSEEVNDGLMIYVNKRNLGRKSAIYSDEQGELVIKYLLSIYEN